MGQQAKEAEIDASEMKVKDKLKSLQIAEEGSLSHPKD
jgi:hypothetical protein